MSKKRAIISVYNKNGSDKFAKELVEKYNYEIVSTGSTAEFLRAAGIPVTDVKEITGLEEMLDGKVKTLHPSIFAGILADVSSASEKAEIENKNIAPISIVAVNLYPFAEVASHSADEKEILKNIDIGGVALLRAAAKNNKNVLSVSSPEQYSEVLDDLKAHNGLFSTELSKKFAQISYNVTFLYDSIIAKTLEKLYGLEEAGLYLNCEKISSLRYGENPHQYANLYKTDKMLEYAVLQGKELSYNNILDTTSALGIVSEFYDVPCCAIIKHNTPCGVALGKTPLEAYQKALDCDPISAFGGIVAFSQTVDENLAKQMVQLFLEVVIAPGFTDEAKQIFAQKKNLRVIELFTPLKNYNEYLTREIRVTPFGVLVQDADKKELDVETFKTVTKEKPTAEQVEDMVFAWKIVKHVKSNAIVVAKDFKTLGICGGQTSRIDAVEMALNKACEGSKDAVLASDGFFPAIDNIHAAVQGRIKAIIQPGGSIKDGEVIAQADKYNMVMIFTGIRHFKH